MTFPSRKPVALSMVESWQVAVWVGAAALLWGACVSAVPGCAGWTPGQKNALIEDIASTTCVLLNAVLPDAKAIAIACNLSPQFIPEIEKLVAAKTSADRITAAKK